MTLMYVIICILGLIFGSFINVLIYRLPDGKSIVSPPACMKCGARHSLLELVPIFSYFFLKGRCRHCGERISVRYPVVELLTAAIFASLFWRFGLSAPFIAYAFLMVILTAVVFIDIDHRIIPDELVLAGLAGGAAGFVYNIVRPGELQYGDNSWWNPLLGMAAGSVTLFIVAVIGAVLFRTDDAMGMGDVKLLAPIGLFLGWRLGLEALILSVVIAGVASLALIISRLKGRKDTIPFGPFIVAGAYVAIMWGWDIIAWYTGL